MGEMFYGITMITKRGKKLYLSFMKQNNPTWSFNVDNTCLFETYEQCESFAKNWFKNFDNYKIVAVRINNKLNCVKI